MARADKAAKNVNRFVRKKIDEKIKREKAKPKMWKGKMIIPLAKWLKKQNFLTHEWRYCYPDQYKPDLLLYPGDEKTIRGYQDEWWSEFCELMESIKDSAFGKLKCKGCILNPVASPLTTNIRDAIISTNQNPDVAPLEFPCKVVNKFECPYKAVHGKKMPREPNAYMRNFVEPNYEFLPDILQITSRTKIK